MPRLTIVLVNYNSGKFLSECLQSIQRVRSEEDFVIYVVDNASSDSSIEEAKKIKMKINFILNKENLGFGKANNQVLKNLKTEYVLVLNPDTTIAAGVIKRLVRYMEQNTNVGAVTCKIVLPDGKIDLTAHRGFPTPWASLKYFLGDDSLYHLSKRDPNTTHEVDAISGAFFLTKKSVLNKVGLFDEDFFMYAEDIDLCFRIKQAGFKVMYVPTVEILHHKGVSSGLKKHSQGVTTATLETRIRSLHYFYETMKIFYKKHYENTYPFFINWLIYLAIDIKWMLAKRKLTV